MAGARLTTDPVAAALGRGEGDVDVDDAGFGGPADVAGALRPAAG